MYNADTVYRLYLVTSFTLVWIKICWTTSRAAKAPCHELHARVD